MNIHENEQEYELPAGIIDETTLGNVVAYIGDIMRFDAKPVPPVEVWRACLKDDFGTYHAICKCAEDHGLQSISCFSVYLNCSVVAHTQDQIERNKDALARQVHRYYSDRYSTPAASDAAIEQVTDMIDEIGDHWLITGSGEYVGTFPKRVAKWMRNHGYKLTTSQVETIGNIASVGVTKVSKYMLTFDRDYIHGSPHEYLNSGSCWWGSNDGARDMLYDAGGYAIRAWCDGSPIARCWYVKQGNYHIIFNSYGTVDLWTFARILAHRNGLTYKKINLWNYGTASGTLYINGGDGIILGADVSDIDEWDLELDELGDVCSRCECRVSEDDARSDDYYIYCPDCFYDIYTDCSCCGGITSNDDVIEYAGNYYCERCADRNGIHLCRNCHEYADDCYDTDIGNVCTACCHNEFTMCDHCENYYSDCDRCRYQDNDTGWICHNCIDDNDGRCSECNYVLIGSNTCPDCGDDEHDNPETETTEENLSGADYCI